MTVTVKEIRLSDKGSEGSAFATFEILVGDYPITVVWPLPSEYRNLEFHDIETRTLRDFAKALRSCANRIDSDFE